MVRQRTFSGRWYTLCGSWLLRAWSKYDISIISEVRVRKKQSSYSYPFCCQVRGDVRGPPGTSCCLPEQYHGRWRHLPGCLHSQDAAMNSYGPALLVSKLFEWKNWSTYLYKPDKLGFRFGLRFEFADFAAWVLMNRVNRGLGWIDLVSKNFQREDHNLANFWLLTSWSLSSESSTTIGLEAWVLRQVICGVCGEDISTNTLFGLSPCSELEGGCAVVFTTISS